MSIWKMLQEDLLADPLTLRLLFLILSFPPAITPTESPDTFIGILITTGLSSEYLNKICMEDIIAYRMELHILKNSLVIFIFNIKVYKMSFRGINKIFKGKLMVHGK